MIENTTDRDPLLHMLGIMDQGQGGYIEGMERQGQQSLVRSETLPTEGDWDRAAELGVVRGEQVPGDSLFTNATLPEGWQKVATDHSMGSEVIDDRGVPRIGIFYKAAFYDRRADFHIIDVGGRVSSHMAYAEGTPKLPDYWDKLTTDEKRDAVEDLKVGLAGMQENLDRGNSDYWQERLDKYQAALDLVMKAGA